tara:strand:+ start:1751 stop:2158 length:408 start_codon:yes stop_codon:yes gene_type:complete
MHINRIGLDHLWTGESREIGIFDGAPKGWTRAHLPDLNEGESAKWVGHWEVIDTPEMVDSKRGDLLQSYGKSRVDVQPAGDIYLGDALVDGSPHDPVWKISKISINADGSTDRTLAQGSNLHDKVWIDHLDYDYS